MLVDGAHVSIGGVRYVLALDTEPHYHHRFESLFAPTTAIAGEIAKSQIRPEKLLWSITDWSGGEGGLIYYPQDPTRYDFASLMNVTQRGMLTSRTKRRRSSVARAGAAATTAMRPAGTSAYATALIEWGDEIVSSADCITWATAQDTSPTSGDAIIADAISDGTNAAFLRASSTTVDVIPVVQADAGVTTYDDAHTGTVPDYPIVGTVVDGLPYTFGLDTTLKVFKKAAVMDTAADWGATAVYNTNIVPVGTWGTNYWTSCTGAETALFVSYATKTNSFVWEIRNDVGRPYWTAPAGFAVKKLVYHLGVLFAIGNQQASGKTFAGIYAIPLVTRSPIFIAAPRRHKNTELASFSIGCPGPGATIYAADENSGKIFIYDMERDALSLFDDLANGGTGDGTAFTANTDKLAFLAMHGSRLFGATWTPGGAGTALQVISWDDLLTDNRDASQAISATLETAEWDFGVPMEIKGLVGFYVTFKVTDSATTSGLIADSRITISYSIDDASYVATTTITSATTPTGAKGRVFVQVSDGTTTKKFTRLKVKIALDNNSSTTVAPPIVYGVTAEAQLLAYAETWDLAVRVEDEDSNERPTSRQNEGAFLRDNLEDLATNKSVVTFLDGFRYKQNNKFTTHTVVVEDPDDEIVSLGEGVMRVRLRAIV